MTRIAAGICLALLAGGIRSPLLAAAAVRITRSGVDSPESQLCYYAARSNTSPIARQLGGTPVVCQSQTAPLPSGVINLFARLSNTDVSTLVELVDTRDPARRNIELRLTGAVPVTPAAPLRPDETLLFYSTTTGSAYPLVEGSALVPTGRMVVPVLVRDGAIAAIGERVEIRTAARVPVPAASPDSSTVVTWLSVAAGDAVRLRALRRPQAPRLMLQTSDGVHKPVDAVAGTVTVNGVIQFFRNAARRGTDATLLLDNAPWRRVSAPVPVGNAPIVVTSKPVELTLASRLNVDWSEKRMVSAPSTPDSPDRCGFAVPARKQRRSITLQVCRGLAAPLRSELLDVQRESCRVLQEHILRSEDHGSETFYDLDPGNYLVELRDAALPPIDEIVNLGIGDEQRLRLDADYVTLSGRVTIGGSRPREPLQLRFGLSSEQLAVTDGEGEYETVLRAPLRSDTVVGVMACGSGNEWEHIVEDDVLPNSRYDIDLPENTIDVSVVDARTGAAVSGAMVRYSVGRSEDFRSFYFYKMLTEPAGAGAIRPRLSTANGKVEITSVPAGRFVHVCAEHSSYTKKCAAPFTLRSNEHRAVTIELEPNGSFQGRIVSAQPFASGTIYWFTSDGRLAERAQIGPDGRFVYGVRHAPGEIAAVVAINQPLFVLEWPFTQPDSPVTIPVPAAPSRTFDVRTDDRTRNAFVTVAVGGIVVPYPALLQHLLLHGSAATLKSGGPLVIPDVLAVGPLAVLLGPDPARAPADTTSIDLFRLPQFAMSERRNVPPDGHVVFDD